MSQYFAFQWHITDECDQRCKHCYIFSGKGCRELKSMTWEQMQEVVANCEDFCKVYNRVPYFYITGGDPILHPDFWKLMVFLKSKNIPFTIMGNPFHLDDEICRMLKVCGCEKYQMSLDGMRETHDWFRKPGSFDLTLEKVGCLNRAGIKSIIMSTVSKTNMNEIPDIIDAVVKANVKVFAFSRYVPTGGEVDTSMTPQNTEIFWKSVTRNTRHMKQRDVKPILIKKTTCGLFTNMRRDSLNCLQMQKKV